MGSFNQETYKVTFNIYVGTQLTQSQTIEAPRQMIEMQFRQVCQQVANTGQPMKAEMVRYENGWDSENKPKQFEYKMDFKTSKDI